MIQPRGVIFDKKLFKRGRVKARDGDSGVGQALESPSRTLKRARLRKTSRFLSHFGTLLIVFSLLGFLSTYGPIVKVEIGYRLSRWFTPDENTQKGSFAELLNQTFLGEAPGVPDPMFSLIIPKIHAKGKVVANVDPGSERDYMEALKLGVAHAAGTHFPGESGTIYLFAHSTDSPLNIIRYNAVFYLLRELETGDEVVVFYQGIKHRYTVSDKKIVEPTDVSYLSPDNSKNKEQLILQTCWPPGTTLKRLLIFAEK